MFGFSKVSKKVALALGVGLLAMGLMAGCGNSSHETAKEGVLRVGSETTFPPFEYTENGQNLGFDVELSQAIADKLGYKMEFVGMGFDALIPAIQSKDIDMIAAGINETPERAQALSFSEPYFTEGGFITIVRKDNTDIQDMDGLANKRVGAQIGTIPVEMANKIPGTTVKQYNDNSQIFMALQAGDIDGAIMDNAVAMFYLKQGADKDLKLVGKATDSPGIVLGFAKDNTKLRDDVNKALKELKEDGTYQKIYDKWFGANGQAK